MDEERFMNACSTVIGKERARSGIGTLSEKTLHAVLKRYYEPDEGCHEQRIGGYIADIVGEQGIIEIQTQGFDKLRKKLQEFLTVAPVTVVYPCAASKWLIWIDPETGQVTKKRRSPKKGTPYQAFFELYKIKHLLCNPGLRLRIVLVDLEEYRYLDGWSENKKRGSSRCERIPVGLAGEIAVDCPADYQQLIPPSLEEPFTSAEFRTASGLSLSSAQTALNVLHHVNAVKRVGKRGNAFLYIRAV